MSVITVTVIYCNDSPKGVCLNRDGAPLLAMIRLREAHQKVWSEVSGEHDLNKYYQAFKWDLAEVPVV